MDGNVELLNYVYQNSEMGTETIEHLLEIVDDSNFKKCLESQYQEYAKINKAAIELIHQHGKEEKDISKAQEWMSSMMISMKTMMDKSPCHIAEMMMQGSVMGIINATKNLNKYQAADKKVVKLMDDLLAMEERNLKELKQFLKE